MDYHHIATNKSSYRNQTLFSCEYSVWEVIQLLLQTTTQAHLRFFNGHRTNLGYSFLNLAWLVFEPNQDTQFLLTKSLKTFEHVSSFQSHFSVLGLCCQQEITKKSPAWQIDSAEIWNRVSGLECKLHAQSREDSVIY